MKKSHSSPQERKLQYYQQANVDYNRRPVDRFLGNKNLRDFNINGAILAPSNTAKNIFSNYIPHKTVTSDDIDKLKSKTNRIR